MKMNIERQETNFVYSSPPYADPLVILNRNNTNSPIIQIYLPWIPENNRLYYFCDNFLKYVQILIRLFPTLVFLLFSIYQVVLACYNCTLEDSDLGWIRASFFLNIPFISGVFIYIIIIFSSKKMPTFDHFTMMITTYIGIYFHYTYFLGIYGEVDEMKTIHVALKNSTIADMLPCPINHYRRVFGMKIASFCSPVLVFFFCCFPCFKCSFVDENRMQDNRLYRFIFVSVNRWRDFKNRIFARHQGNCYWRNLIKKIFL